jgi:FkbM family methyltransferase
MRKCFCIFIYYLFVEHVHCLSFGVEAGNAATVTNRWGVVPTQSSTQRRFELTAHDQDTLATGRPPVNSTTVLQQASDNKESSLPNSVTSQTYPQLMEMYAKCLRSPAITLNAVTGNCEVFSPFRSIWRASGFQADPTHCQPLLAALRSMTNSTSEQRPSLQVHNVALRRKSSDCKVALQILCNADFEFLSSLAPFMPTDSRPVTFLDAGSNIGLAAILFAEFIGLHGEVIAVEANMDSFHVTEDNTQHLSGVITRVHAAIVTEQHAARSAVVELSGPADEYWAFRVDRTAKFRSNNAVLSESVRAVTLKVLMERARSQQLDFIKLDIEGMERDLLLEGASRRVLCQARCIFMELHDRYAPGASTAFNDFLLSGCGDEPGASDRFIKVVVTGEYHLVCRTSLVHNEAR